MVLVDVIGLCFWSLIFFVVAFFFVVVLDGRVFLVILEL